MEFPTVPSTVKQILILGGSYGGISTAHYLLKHVIPKLPDSTSYQVVLVSAPSQVICRPACPRALLSDDFFNQDKLFVNIPKAFEQYSNNSFRFIHGTVTNLDHVDRCVEVSLANGDTETIEFHASVVATGASTPSPLLGLNRDEVYLKQSWADFRKALPAAKNIVIAGGGPAGVEVAGELGEYLNGRAGWLSKPAPKVTITIFTSGPQILPGLRASIAAKAERYLAHVGVTVVKNRRIVSVTQEGNPISSKATLKLEKGEGIETDLYIPATGLKPNTSFMSASLLTPSSHVLTNPSTLRVDEAGPRIYAIGDVASTARPAVHLILNAIPILCANMKKDLLLAASRDGGEDRKYVIDESETQLVPIGESKGVGAAMGWALPSWMVWAIKGRDYWLWTTGKLWSGEQWSKES